MLAPTRAGRIWVVTVAGCLAIKHWIPLLRQTAVPMRIRGIGTVWLSDWSQLMVAWEVFSMHTYSEHPLPDDATTILDLGANVGLASLFFRLRYPGARIVAVEADPAVARLAERNLRGWGVDVVNAAVAPAAGIVTLHRQPGQSWASSTVFGKGEPVDVKAVALDTLIDQLGGVSILKLDIEGAEHDVIAASRRLDAVDCIVGEVHPVEGSSADRFFAMLGAFDVVTGPMVDGNGTFVARRRLGGGGVPASGNSGET